jgi:hypothetical protein
MSAHAGLRQARYHSSALILLVLFYLPPAIYAVASMARVA